MIGNDHVRLGLGAAEKGPCRETRGTSPAAYRYFVLCLRGPNCGYGRVMVKLADALYHRRRGEQLLAGCSTRRLGRGGDGRRWRPPEHLLAVAGGEPVGGLTRCTCGSTRSPAPSGVRPPTARPGRSAAGCGWVHGRLHHRRARLDSKRRALRAALECHPGMGRSRRSAGCRGVGDRGADRGHARPVHGRRADPGSGRRRCSCWPTAPRTGRAALIGAHPGVGLGLVQADPHRGAGDGSYLAQPPRRTGRRGRRSPCGSSSTPCTPSIGLVCTVYSMTRTVIGGPSALRRGCSWAR